MKCSMMLCALVFTFAGLNFGVEFVTGRAGDGRPQDRIIVAVLLATERSLHVDAERTALRADVGVLLALVDVCVSFLKRIHHRCP